MLRSFSILEESISELACKLVAGARSLNGAQPNRLFQARSVAGARTAMLTWGRRKPRQYLNWNKVDNIKANTFLVLAGSEPFLSYSALHGASTDEMRKIRNFVAHRSQSARIGYREVIRSTYGANPPVAVGTFLVTTSRWNPAKIDKYLETTKVIIQELAAG